MTGIVSATDTTGENMDEIDARIPNIGNWIEGVLDLF